MYAALAEFAKKGYEIGNVGMIAKQANVSKGSMYQYFEDKEEFYLYLAGYAYSMIKTALRSELQLLETQKADLQVVVKEMRRILWNLLEQYPMELSFLFSTKGEHEESVVSSLKRLCEAFYQQTLQPMLEHALCEGQIRDDIPMEYLLLYCQGIQGMLQKKLQVYIVYNREENHVGITIEKEVWNQIYDTIATMMLTGLIKD